MRSRCRGGAGGNGFRKKTGVMQQQAKGKNARASIFFFRACGLIFSLSCVPVGQQRRAVAADKKKIVLPAC